jgi:hypothetical protein
MKSGPHGQPLSYESYNSVDPTYNTYLTDKEDLPRLSILTNFKQIMRVMNKQQLGDDIRFKKPANTDSDGNEELRKQMQD